MSQDTVILPTSSEVSTKQPFETQGYQLVIVSADNLAGAEEVGLFKQAGATWLTVVDSTGAAQKLTASITMLTLAGGSRYAVTKTSTTGLCGVYVDRQVQV